MPSATFLRYLAFSCAVFLSIGGHFGRELLGPLKTQLLRSLGSDNLHFALIFSAYSLNSTWTPLITPYVASYIGMSWTSVVATATILFGQSIVALSSVLNLEIGILIGLLIFGLGLSPVAVCTEFILIRFFKSHSLGMTLALGLLGGKGASFLSSITAFPLSRISPHLPFFLGAILALTSFLANLIYLRIERPLVEKLSIRDQMEAPVIVEESEDKGKEVEARKMLEARKVRVGDVAFLGDSFWVYILFSGLCGALWNPATHNYPHILQLRYHWSEGDSAFAGSLILSGALVMYPLAGLLIDRRKTQQMAINFLFATSFCTLAGFLWLSLPPSISKTPSVSIAFHTIGTGLGTLSLVLAVPFIVREPWIATALGLHKAIESAFSSLAQSMIGLELDKRLKRHQNITPIMLSFVAVNLIQLFSVILLRRLLRRDQKRLAWDARRTDETLFTPTEEVFADFEDGQERTPLLQKKTVSPAELQCCAATHARGRIAAGLSCLLVATTWIVFIAIGMKKKQ